MKTNGKLLGKQLVLPLQLQCSQGFMQRSPVVVPQQSRFVRVRIVFKSPLLLPFRVPGQTTLRECELCVNESHISQSKVKSSEKETFVLIFSLSFIFILLADISISYFCFQVLSEEPLSHAVSHCSVSPAHLRSRPESPGWRQERRQQGPGMLQGLRKG